jgi:uncharacterized repeat protein (TIGR01451 family)
MRATLAAIAAGIFFGGLVGCSGGGGGGGGGGPTPVQYTGNTNPAVISTSNAAVLTANAANTETGADVAGAFSSVASSQTGERPADVPWRVAQRVGAAAMKPTSNAALTSVPVNETDPCANGGSVSINGDLTPGGTGTVNVTFRNCGEGGDLLNGTATLRIDSVLIRPAPQQSLLTNFTVSFGRLSLRGSANVDLGGSVHVVIDLPFNKETVTESAVVLNLDTGQMTKADFTFELIFDNLTFPSRYTKSVTGRAFHSVHGFVDIRTITPLSFGSTQAVFPQSGEVELTGANGASILVTALSATAVRLSLNLDNGLPGFERVVTLAWADLTGPAGSDLRDSDLDGMHDSWEVVYGLNPNLNDASLDSDGDGVTNLVEYQNGSKPNDVTSRPPQVQLSVAFFAPPGPLAAGPLAYTITVTNSGFNAAHDVVLADTLPAGVAFVSATPTQGSCSGTTPVTCNLNTVGASSIVNVNIVITTVPGNLINTATVSTSSFDPVTGDNTATGNTLVN